MPGVSNTYQIHESLVLGKRDNQRVPIAEQARQRTEAEEILSRLRKQPGIILADEVGMGKTFVALAVAYCVGLQNPRGPVVVMVPPNLIEKWEQDLDAFCELYLNERTAISRATATPAELRRKDALRFGSARNSVEFLKLLDDSKRTRCQIIFLAQGAMSRGQTDIWVRLALIRETLRRHSRRQRLSKVKKQIHRFVGELLYAKGQQRASTWDDDLWWTLLRKDPGEWQQIYNDSLRTDRQALNDDPVPASIVKALSRMDLTTVADALGEMPIRASGTSSRLSERIDEARLALRDAEKDLWKQLLAKARWRSPLLILDEAHHLKNPRTALARQLQSIESAKDLKLGDGALSGSFDRMLFLTATPFQLGHHELVRVMQRFGDVRWDTQQLGQIDDFERQLHALNDGLTASQRAAIRLQRAWTRLGEDDLVDSDSLDDWWDRVHVADRDDLTHRQRTLIECYEQAKSHREQSQQRLRPWIVRHNKGEYWSGQDIPRRKRLDGAAVSDDRVAGGIGIPDDQLMPFFLAARSAASRGKDLLGEALSSSYEAFRHTRRENAAGKDDVREEEDSTADLTHSGWFLSEFDRAIEHCSSAVHPKIHTTVQQAADLWEAGEKVLVFAFYRHTCRALRVHISQELEKRLLTHARRRLGGAGRPTDEAGVHKIIDSIQNRFFDTTKAPGRRALDRALHKLLERHRDELVVADVDTDELVEVMRRFLRVQTTLVRAFPIHEHDSIEPHLAVRSMLDSQDSSGVSWRDKFRGFVDFLLHQCSHQERLNYLAATGETRGIRVHADDALDDSGSSGDSLVTLANVRMATGETDRTTRSRLMRAFNTPFFPDIFVCSQVMGEGVDLHRFCRHVIHHDLDWNPSSIEQRTGRVDRLGCKAEHRNSILVYLPYLSGTADERQYRVMTDRESWFRIVMGQEEVERLIPKEADGNRLTPPKHFQRDLVFDLSLL